MKIHILNLLILSVLFPFTSCKENTQQAREYNISYWSTYGLHDVKRFKNVTHVHVVDEYGKAQILTLIPGEQKHILRLSVQDRFSEWPDKLNENPDKTESIHRIYYTVENKVGDGRWQSWYICVRKNCTVTCNKKEMLTSKDYHKAVYQKIIKFKKSDFEFLLKTEK